MSNIGEKLNFREAYYVLGRELYQRILNQTNGPVQKIVIAIGGESGCGKSTTAYCLEKEFNEKGIKCETLHMDSYFILPPKDNHLNRLKNLDNVGPHEVNMSRLDQHITAFKNGDTQIEIPVVDYIENCFTQKQLDLSNIEVLIVEGVYSFLLKNLDHKIFLSRTYHETFHNRIKRTREEYDPIVELILEIEHKVIHPLIDEADFIIKKDYTIK